MIELLLTPITALPTAADRWQGLRSGVQQPPNYSAVIWVAGGLLLLLIGLLVARRFMDRERGSKTDRGPDLLNLAMNTLGLTIAERRLIAQLIEKARPIEPAAILLTPANLALAVHAAAGPEDYAALRNDANRLCQRVFSIDLPRVDS